MSRRSGRFTPRLVWLFAAATAYTAGVFLHLPVTDAVEWLLPRMGLAAYDRLWTVTAAVLGLAASGFLWSRDPSAKAAAVSALWPLLAVFVLAQALLVVAPIEFVHYPQYALVAGLLARAGLPLEWTWLMSVGLGMLDEGHQRLVLPRGTPDYFDWNDVVLNATGAAMGLTLLSAVPHQRWRLTFTRRFTLVALAAAAAAAFVLAPPVLRPYLTETPRHTWFRVLSPVEAVGLLGGLWSCVRRLGRSAPS